MCCGENRPHRIRYLFMLLPAVLCSCTSPSVQRPEAPAVSIVRVYRAYSTLANPRSDMPVSIPAPLGELMSRQITQPDGNTYQVIERGGATVLSPLLLITSDHLGLGSKTGAMHIENQGLIQSTVIDSAVGWEIRKLEKPILGMEPTRFVSHPEEFQNQKCLIPISCDIFKMNNPDSWPSIVYETDHGICFLEGEVKSYVPQFTPPESIGHMLAIKLRSKLDLSGASGYPVLIFDEEKHNWVVLAVIDKGSAEPTRNETWILARYPDQAQLDSHQAD